MTRLFSAIFFFCITFIFSVQAQTISGYVLDAKTMEPLPFVNVGVLHRNTGTVTDLNGKFTLDRTNVLPSDSVKISLLGYQAAVYRVADLGPVLAANKGRIRLEPQVKHLKEVVVKPRKTKIITAGNTTDSRNMTMGFTSNDLGSEIGTVLKYRKKKAGKLETVNFNLAMNRFDRVLFRVNVYEFKDGKAGQNLLQEPLYLSAEIDAGTLTAELGSQEIYLTGDCLLTLEWIEDLGKKGLMFSMGLLNGTTYARKTSHADWFRVNAGIGFWAEISVEK